MGFTSNRIITTAPSFYGGRDRLPNCFKFKQKKRNYAAMPLDNKLCNAEHTFRLNAQRAIKMMGRRRRHRHGSCIQIQPNIVSISYPDALLKPFVFVHICCFFFLVESRIRGVLVNKLLFVTLWYERANKICNRTLAFTFAEWHAGIGIRNATASTQIKWSINFGG